MERRLFPAQAAKEPGDAGFTLVEMMVVVSIIGILAAVAIPRYMAYAKSSQTAEVGNIAGSMVAAMGSYADAQGLTPTTTASTFAAATLTPGGTGATELTTLIPQFTMPTNSKFSYTVSTAVATGGPQAGETVYCIQAKGRANSGVLADSVVVYSTAQTKAANWDGRINRQAFDAAQTGAITITAGGYCTTAGAASAAYVP